MLDKLYNRKFSNSRSLDFRNEKDVRISTKLKVNDDEYKVQVNDENFLSYLQEFATFAQEAYCLSDQPEDVTSYAFQNLKFKEFTEIIVYFRGNEMNIEKWKQRETIQRLYPGLDDGYVDKMFYSRFQKVEKNLLERLGTFLNGDFQQSIFRFTGHGEGGVFAALAFHKKFPFIDSNIITFGQPRMGNGWFANYVNNLFPNAIRVTHSDDYVSQYPDKSNGYQHHQTEYWISDDLNCNCPDPQLLKNNTEITAFNVFKCTGKISEELPAHGYLLENLQCNNKKRANVFSGLSSHFGPYFGKMMGFCPPPYPSVRAS
ncbi:hypothetical protein G9A89_021769 [Geosiphon pyriformis]|nr:hypothetical protein G9A89_021769 [Geosiphon pyriformis]